MDWESVLNHVERMRQLDLSSDEEGDLKAEEKKESEKERKERKGDEKKKHLVHTDSTETQSTRLSDNSLIADDNNTDPFTVMDTVREEEEEDAKRRRRRESSMLSESTVRWKLIFLVMPV